MPAITQQLGLLEDDIVYRLALLCVNVLQPLRDHYPNIVVTSGFRQTNNGISQHELGEAADIQIRNQTPELLYEVADYIQKNLPFDQLVLNFTKVGGGQPWIHVSFSADNNREQVLTKDYADNFHEGLFLVDPLTGEAAAEALRQQAEQDALIFAELDNLHKREERLGTKSSVIADEAADETGGGGGPDDGPGPPLPQRIIDILFGIQKLTGVTSDSDDGFRRDSTRKVAEQICFEFGPTWGHKQADAGRPPSADVFAQQQPDGSLYGWDWQSSGGVRNPPTFYNITGQVFIPVSPVNHLNFNGDTSGG